MTSASSQNWNCPGPCWRRTVQPRRPRANMPSTRCQSRTALGAAIPCSSDRIPALLRAMAAKGNLDADPHPVPARTHARRPRGLPDAFRCVPMARRRSASLTPRSEGGCRESGRDPAARPRGQRNRASRWAGAVFAPSSLRIGRRGPRRAGAGCRHGPCPSDSLRPDRPPAGAHGRAAHRARLALRLDPAHRQPSGCGNRGARPRRPAARPGSRRLTRTGPARRRSVTPRSANPARQTLSGKPGPGTPLYARPRTPAPQPSRDRAAPRASSVTMSPASIRAISSIRAASSSGVTVEVVIPSATRFSTRQ
ncbi:hypothetical protein PARU111607_17925 [Palleronia rufa]